MPEAPKKATSVLSTLVMYLLASPILALRAIGTLVSARRASRLVRAGFLRCAFCGAGNRLDVLVTCTRCGFAEHRSLALPCSECGYVPAWVFCTGCGASLRLP